MGESLGVVSEAENPKELVGNDFFHVKVEVDISKPLCQGRKIDIGEGNERWVSFKYEKLPNVCYWCGLVSHDEKECEKWLTNRGFGSEEVQGYGAWLKATPYNPGKSSFTTVSGMVDGLGGLNANNTIEQLAKSRKKPLVHTQSTSQTQPITESQPSVNSQNGLNMDMAKNRDVPQQISCKNSSQNPQVINNIPIIYPSPHPKDFESQIKEIDVALKKFESHDYSTPNKTVGSSIFTTSSGDNLRVNVDRVDNGEYQNEAHVDNQPLPIIPYTIELKKWKKLAHNIPKTDAGTQNPVAVKQGREGDDEIQLKLPCKKYQVSRVDGQDISMVKAIQQPRQSP